MRYLSFAEVVELHRLIIEASGGAQGLRDLGSLESAIAQPRMSFAGEDLYPSLVEKAAALCFSLVRITLSLTATSGSGTQPWRRSWF